ncbi:zinc finger protein [Cricetulus griseus]|uniref:Zinc finger protein n=1 Tax=Cricetulus griseus TaxID=10029 RepID=A0A061I4U7_CRIGR|nr:zinc finger protein [Cricetulus griseus]
MGQSGVQGRPPPGLVEPERTAFTSAAGTGVMPNTETEFLLTQIFGRTSYPMLKFLRMKLWLTRFKNINPYPVPRDLPQDPLDLAKLSLRRMEPDLSAKVTVYQKVEEIPEEWNLYYPMKLDLEYSRSGWDNYEFDLDEVGNGLAAGSSDSSSSSSSSDSEEPPEAQPAKAPAAAAVTPASPACSSGLITQEGVHIPFDVHHVESLAEQGTPLCQNPAGGGPEALETVVCVPVPMQMGTGPGTLFENMPQEALGEVVASCPVSGMVPGSQVIIIAGPGYDTLTAEGIHLNVAAGSGTPSSGLGEEVPCAMMEGVAAYTQTEPEGTQHSTMDTTSIVSIETKKDAAPCHPVEKEDLYMLKEEKEDSVAPELAELAATMPETTEAEADVDGEELDGSDMSAIIYEIPKEPEKRRRSKRSRVMDADGLLEMFHCPYEGCSQVYVALSSFQNHVNLVHRKGKTKVCPHPGCGKKFYLSNHLRRHMIIHSGQAPPAGTRRAAVVHTCKSHAQEAWAAP